MLTLKAEKQFCATVGLACEQKKAYICADVPLGCVEDWQMAR